MREKKTFNITVFIAVLFHLTGIIGMNSDARAWFISMTPFTLALMTGLTIWNEKTIHKGLILLFILCFSVGYMAEVVGTNTGLLFGDYEYGSAFGFKVLNVPILIGVLWFITVYSIGHTVLFGYRLIKKDKVRSLSTNLLLVISAGALTTLFDFIMEPAAISLGYWAWYPNGTIPLFNYSCWFLISSILLVPFYMIEELSNEINYFAIVLITIQTIFFLLI